MGNIVDSSVRRIGEMPPVKALPPTKPKTVLEKCQAWARTEYYDEQKFYSNMVRDVQSSLSFARRKSTIVQHLWGVTSVRSDSKHHKLPGPFHICVSALVECRVACLQSLLRAVGMFSASVFVIINFGDAFAI